MFLVLKWTHPENYVCSIILEIDYNGELDHKED